jgi:hypothetical protein
MYIGRTIYCELDGELVYLEILSSYKCKIYHIQSNLSELPIVFDSIETVDINEDKRFADVLDFGWNDTQSPLLLKVRIDAYSPILLDIRFNKDYFTLGEVYSYGNRIGTLISYDVHELSFESLSNDTSDRDYKKYQIHAGDLYTDITYNGRLGYHSGNITEVDINNWWDKTFSRIKRVERVNGVVERTDLLPKTIEKNQTVYKYKDNLVYIKNVDNDKEYIHLGIIGINNCDEYDMFGNRVESLNKNITHEDAIHNLIPVYSMSDSDTLEPLSYVPTLTFADMNNCVHLFKFNSDVDILTGQKYFDNMDKIYKFEYSAHDCHIFTIHPEDIIATYKIIPNKIPTYEASMYHKLYKTLEILNEYSLYEAD